MAGDGLQRAERWPSRDGSTSSQLAKVAGVGFLRWRHGTDGHGQRVIAAPLDRVFAALIDPEALTAWLPPDGMSGRFEQFDARPGGSYRLVLTYADASSARGKATADSDIVEARLSTSSLVCGWCRPSTSFPTTRPTLAP